MTKITHWHGMTESSYNHWINGKGKQDCISPWTVSDNDGLTYLWGVEELASEYDSEDEDDKQNNAMSCAFDSALCQWCQCYSSEYIYLIGMSLDHADFVEPDVSCRNMHGAFCIPESEFNITIAKKIVRIKINKWLKPFQLAVLIDREMYSIRNDIDSELLTLAQNLKYSEVGDQLESLSFYNYNPEIIK